MNEPTTASFLPNKNNSASAECLMHKVTLNELKDLMSGSEFFVTQIDVDEINKKPLCREFCLEQLNYSKKYKDWFAEEDL